MKMNKLELASFIIPRAISAMTKLGAGGCIVLAGLSAGRADFPGVFTGISGAMGCLAGSFVCDCIIDIQKKMRG
jgi:hypothetical protein